jgi:hypothetical protein
MMRVLPILIGLARAKVYVWTCPDYKDLQIQLDEETTRCTAKIIYGTPGQDGSRSSEELTLPFSDLEKFKTTENARTSLFALVQQNIQSNMNDEIWANILSQVLNRKDGYLTFGFFKDSLRTAISVNAGELIVYSPECSELVVKIPQVFFRGLESFNQGIPPSFIDNFPPGACDPLNKKLLEYLSNTFPLQWQNKSITARFRLDKMEIDGVLGTYSLTVPLSLQIAQLDTLDRTSKENIELFLGEVLKLGCLNAKSWYVTVTHWGEGQHIATLFESASFTSEEGSSSVNLSCLTKEPKRAFIYKYLPGTVPRQCDPDTYSRIQQSRVKKYNISVDTRQAGTRARNREVAYKFCKALYLIAQKLLRLLKKYTEVDISVQ